MTKYHMKKKKITTAKLANDVEWYGRSWAGVIEYAQSLGLKYTDLGTLVENYYGDRTTFKQVIFAQQVHKSLSMVPYYRRDRIKMAPTGEESDMHYAIRMDKNAIFKLYAVAGGKAKDKFKGVAALYSKVYKRRKKEVEAYLFTDKLSKKQMKELAEKRSEALGYKGFMDKLK